MFENRSVAYLNATDEAVFLASLKSPKFYFLALLLDDCFMRVSEAAALKVKDFNFQKPSVFVRSLKKRGKNAVREVPMTRRAVDAAAAYWTSLKEKPAPDDYVFPAGNGKEDGHLSRKRIWAVFKKCGGVNPHKLRHTGATRLIENGASLLVARDLLGHDGTRTTEIYLHTSEERARLAVNAIERSTLFERWKAKLFPSKNIYVLPVAVGATKYHVGRQTEFNKLTALYEKRVNTLLLGPQGIGKSHILDNFKADNLLRIDDCSDFKKTLANIVIKLCEGDKANKMELLAINPEVVTKQSVKRTIEMLMQLTEPQEYTLLFDDVTKITPSAVVILEKLRAHFHIIAAARQIAISNASWLTNFEKITIEPLKRPEALELIKRSAEDFKKQIEDFTAFQTAVYQATNGVPLAIHEMVQRWRAEGYVRADAIQSITHTGVRREHSIVPILLVGLGVFALAKVYGREADAGNKEAYMIMSGIAVVLLMLSGKIMGAIRQKFV